MNVLHRCLEMIGNALPPPYCLTADTAASVVHHLLMMRRAADANNRNAFWHQVSDLYTVVCEDLGLRDQEIEADRNELEAFHEAQNATKH
jgi:hypothetical protein